MVCQKFGAEAAPSPAFAQNNLFINYQHFQSVQIRHFEAYPSPRGSGLSFAKFSLAEYPAQYDEYLSMAHQVAQVENRPMAVRLMALYHMPVVFMMLGLKLATDRVEITSIMFHSPKNVGEAMASGPVPPSRMSYENACQRLRLF
jgi:hypothetical protein